MTRPMPEPTSLIDEPLTGADPSLDSLLQKAAHVSVDGFEPLVPRIGQVIGNKYRLDARLGRGGMGVVFRATHLLSNKTVALKWMARSAADRHSHGRARFLREARIAARVDHPNVVDVYDVGEDASGGYIVMELLHGESLRARLTRGPLEVEEAVALLLPAMRGISAVHHAGVVHRDIKPDNIFLCAGPDGAKREAKVLDFGISAIVANDPSDPTLTRDGVVLGTPGYMSPEQLQNAREVDGRTDVYACGVILYEALTGRLPFAADNLPALVLAIACGKPAPLSRRRPDVPRALERIVLRALATRPEDRFASMDALLSALSACTSAARTTARLRTSRIGTIARRRRTPLHAFAALTVLVTALGSRCLAPSDQAVRAQAALVAAPTGQNAPAVTAPEVFEVPPVVPPEPTAADAPTESGRTAAPPTWRALAPRPRLRRAQPRPRPVAAVGSAAPLPPDTLSHPRAVQHSRSGRISVDEL